MTKIIQMKNSKLSDEIHKVFPLEPEIKKALAHTNREAFVPTGLRHHAYKLDALPMSAQQWISSPLTVAKMTQYLSPKGADRVLEVGCGSGYQAAVLSHLFRGVFTIERIEPLLREAKERFRSLGIMNVHARNDDGQNGWIQYAPYDRILFSASAQSIPTRLVEQLCEGGILVAPVEINAKQVIMRYRKLNGKLIQERLDECIFVPVLDGVQK
ncbi:MAG: protein-L-isoaspartate(D-aspartate) O-methyltransferase [Campylobacterota bacterium]|nr:protein-L-isoaspartate(D-aspartate) O-methyltransferase [Campylobacterota bacterium]